MKIQNRRSSLLEDASAKDAQLVDWVKKSVELFLNIFKFEIQMHTNFFSWMTLLELNNQVSANQYTN